MEYFTIAFTARVSLGLAKSMYHKVIPPAISHNIPLVLTLSNHAFIILSRGGCTMIISDRVKIIDKALLEKCANL